MTASEIDDALAADVGPATGSAIRPSGAPPQLP